MSLLFLVLRVRYRFLEDRTGGYLGAHQAGSLALRKRLAKVQADSNKDSQVRLRIEHHPFAHAPPCKMLRGFVAKTNDVLGELRRAFHQDDRAYCILFILLCLWGRSQRMQRVRQRTWLPMSSMSAIRRQ